MVESFQKIQFQDLPIFGREFVHGTLNGFPGNLRIRHGRICNWLARLDPNKGNQLNLPPLDVIDADSLIN